MNQLTQLCRRPLSGGVAAATLLALPFAMAQRPTAPVLAAPPAARGCNLKAARGAIRHVIYIQFDNVHVLRDNPNVPSDLEHMLRQFVAVGATDGYQVTVSRAEILPDCGHERVLLAYAEPLAPADGAVELIVPGDTLAGRDVRNVNQIVVGTPLGPS